MFIDLFVLWSPNTWLQYGHTLTSFDFPPSKSSITNGWVNVFLQLGQAFAEVLVFSGLSIVFVFFSSVIFGVIVSGLGSGFGCTVAIFGVEVGVGLSLGSVGLCVFYLVLVVALVGFWFCDDWFGSV